MSSPEEAAEWPALSYSTKITGTELCQGKSERKGGFTQKWLHLLWESPVWDNSTLSKVLYFYSNLHYEANLIRLENFVF